MLKMNSDYFYITASNNDDTVYAYATYISRLPSVWLLLTHNFQIVCDWNISLTNVCLTYDLCLRNRTRAQNKDYLVRNGAG